MISVSPTTTYPIFARIFEARERDLIARLPTLYPNESDQMIAQEILVPLWRSCLATALGSFMQRTRPLASERPSAETLAQLCSTVDKAIRENRFLCDIDGRGKPICEYIVGCRKSVGAAIVKELETERQAAAIRAPMRRPRTEWSERRPRARAHALMRAVGRRGDSMQGKAAPWRSWDRRGRGLTEVRLTQAACTGYQRRKR
jgi:hypothetical protein